MLCHVLPRGSSTFLINPIRLIPVLFGNQAELDLGVRKGLYATVARCETQHEHRESATYSLNSSEKGSSFRKTYGYWNSLLKRSSTGPGLMRGHQKRKYYLPTCFMLTTTPGRSLLRARKTKVALALRD